MRQRQWSELHSQRTIQQPTPSEQPIRTFYANQRTTFQQETLSELERCRRQFNNLEKDFRRRRHSSKDVIFVQSRAEHQLMKFLSPGRNFTVERKPSQQSPLHRILKKRQSYKTKYFEQIDKTRKNLSRLNSKYKEMPVVRIGRWQLKGLMGRNSLLIRASDGNKQLCQKYELSDPNWAAQGAYEQFLQQKYGWMDH